MAKWKVKGEYTPFPPPQQPSKIDQQLESGEFFLLEKDRHKQKQVERETRQEEKRKERKEKRAAELVPPVEGPKAKRVKTTTINAKEKGASNEDSVDLERLKKKSKRKAL